MDMGSSTSFLLIGGDLIYIIYRLAAEKHKCMLPLLLLLLLLQVIITFVFIRISLT